MPPIKIKIIIGVVLILIIILSAKIYAEKLKKINCLSFQTHLLAQSTYESDPVKYKALDTNNNGIACEKLK